MPEPSTIEPTTLGMDQELEEQCAHHPSRPGVARCWRCGSPLCIECHHPNPIGFASCERCPPRQHDGAPHQGEQRATTADTPWEDEHSDSALDAFLSTAWAAIRSPTRFYQGLRDDGSWLPAVVFGIACLGVGVLFGRLWSFMLDANLEAQLVARMGKDAPPLPVVRALAFAQVPFVAPVTFLMHVVGLRTGLVLAGVRDPSWKTTARVVGYACAGYLFMTIPSFGAWRLGGHTLMIFWVYNMEIIGMQRFFHVPPLRALFVALLPLVLTMSCV